MFMLLKIKSNNIISLSINFYKRQFIKQRKQESKFKYKIQSSVEQYY